MSDLTPPLYFFNEEEQDKLLEEMPWKDDPKYFKKVKISAVALIKMVMHAISGGNIEVMGMMQGKVINDEFIVLDAFGLPVEGTETRVNAGASANEYMVQYVTSCEEIGKTEGTCGWYHSHPGYGCWLSGIDVGTQYRSIVMAYTQEQKELAMESREIFQRELFNAGLGTITTEIMPVTEFFYAEEYHQQYLAKNPGGYCGLGGTGAELPESFL